MHFSAIILSLGLAATNTVLAVPSAGLARDVPESVSNATALGVDVYGAIPSDAVKVDDHHWEAAPGSKAWAWIRAQIDLGADNSKRQGSGPANIGIGMFAQDWCN
jgi:hypothetical protein